MVGSERIEATSSRVAVSADCRLLAGAPDAGVVVGSERGSLRR